MSRRAILHIGTEKTGTTTLQVFLKTNRERLLEKGFVYPRFCGEVNQTGLAAFAMNDERQDPLRQALGIRGPGDMHDFRRRFRAAAALELGEGRTAIFCNEHCHSRLKMAAEIARLRDFLGAFFDRISVTVYLRRQDQLALSLYTTRLKSGGTEPELFPRTNADDLFFNYNRSLRLWEDVFGRENVTVRLFGRDALVGGSIVADFLSVWGIGTPGISFRSATRTSRSCPRRRNSCASSTCISAAIPTCRARSWGTAVDPFSRHFAGPGVRPSRAAALAFYGQFRASNTALAARHFPQAGALFAEDFGAYPEAADDRSLTVEGAAEVAARLQETWLQEVRRLEAELAIRDARIDWDRGQTDRAVRTLREASLRYRNHPPLFRYLGELLLRTRD